MADDLYSGLVRFIHYTENEMGVKICLKDNVGFISLERELEIGVIENIAHNNPYCMYMKSDENVYMKCTSMIQRTLRKLEKNPLPYCGVCHAGVKEYVYPIRYHGRTIGSVNAGVFAVDEAYADSYVKHACQGSCLDSNTACALYHANITEKVIDEEKLYTSLGMIATAFSLIFARINVHNDFSELRPGTALSRSLILSLAIEYLKRHYLEDVRVSDIAKYCHCSVSCISHMFKERVGSSIPLYITKLRLDFARNQLETSSLSISAIADQAGFTDPNYFSRIFTQYVGLTPSQYRKGSHKNR